MSQCHSSRIILQTNISQAIDQSPTYHLAELAISGCLRWHRPDSSPAESQVMSCTIESPQSRSNIFPVIEDFPARGRFECLWRYLLSSFPLQAGLWNKRSAMIIEQPHMPTHTPLLVQHKQKGAPRRHLHLHGCHGNLLRDISWLESDFRQSKKHNRAKH